MALSQSVKAFIDCHVATVYAALSSVKNYIRPSFIQLQSAAYSSLKRHGKNVAMPPKDSAAVSLGRKGGKATARNRSPEERIEAARKAVEARWAKQRKLVKEIKEGSAALLRKAQAAQARLAKRKKEPK